MRHLLNREPEHQTESLTQVYELGKWHESRGHLEEALKCFKQGAVPAKLVNTSAGTPQTQKELALNWIEYGRLSARLNNYEEAERSFRQALCFGMPYTATALKEWALLLHRQGISDSNIFSQLSKELSSYSIAPSVFGCILTEIGAYKEAVISFNMSEYTDTQSGIDHVRCLIIDGQLNEAMDLLIYLNHKRTPFDWKWDEQYEFISLATFLCKWRLSGSLPYLPASEDDRLKLARAALSVGMISEAEFIVSSEGELGEHALIYFLYSEGYIALAETRLQQLPDLTQIQLSPYGTKVQFIAAERLYDLHEYEKASKMFENIRLSQSEHTNARFGEAACYLQSALLSLSSRVNRINCSRTIKEQAMEYMNSINAALHIVENTNWHTTWTPAQRRRQHGIGQTSLLN